MDILKEIKELVDNLCKEKYYHVSPDVRLVHPDEYAAEELCRNYIGKQMVVPTNYGICYMVIEEVRDEFAVYKFKYVRETDWRGHSLLCRVYASILQGDFPIESNGNYYEPTNTYKTDEFHKMLQKFTWMNYK